MEMGRSCRVTTPMGSWGSLYGSAREKICTKSGSNDQARGSFTQVRAAEQRKTLLLLWFIKDVLELRYTERLR